MSPPPSAAGPPPGSEEPPVPPELPATPPSWPALDRLGLTQAIGGLALGLIALFTSYDHLTFAGRNIPIPQQWGIPLIAASVAIVFTGCVQYGAPLRRDAELASGSRLRAARDSARAAEEAARAADETTRERHLASEERQRAEQRENEADRERNLASEERQRGDRERNRYPFRGRDAPAQDCTPDGSSLRDQATVFCVAKFRDPAAGMASHHRG
ncbi:MAG: hypothetical protein NTZ40_00165, partial [Cyanobacteria bacterium]|nr:hypothetical protein [Cyanobacteriota bacterium]